METKPNIDSWYTPKVKTFDCDMCEDTGEVSTMEYVYAGEPHMADIGTKPCICRMQERDSDESWKEQE